MTSATSTPADVGARLREIVEVAVDRKAQDLKVLHLEELNGFTEYFLICSGTSERQVQAIADAMVERSKAEDRRPLGVEGYRHGRWVLLDFGSFIAHVFDQETRDFYGLENLWADSDDVTASFVS